MSRCTSPEIGKLMHAYELGQLSETDMAAFEEHLVICSHCYDEVARFEPAAGLLRADSEIQVLAAATARADQKAGWLTKLKSVLWPGGTPLVLKPAVTYIALALLVYPAYLGLRDGSAPTVQSTQTVVLSGTRSTTQPLADNSAPVALVFRVGGAAAGDTLIVSIADEAGFIVFSDPAFSRLSPARLGTISFAQGALAAGPYSLTIADQAGDTLAEYRFRIE